MDQTILEQMEYDQVALWHRHGITGKNVVIWNTENNSAEHGKMTTSRIKHAAPDAEVINASLSMSSDRNQVYYSYAVLSDGTKVPTEEFIKTRNIKLVTRSVAGGTATDTTASRFWNDLKARYNLVFFNSAGNDGSEGASGGLPPDVAIFVAACGLNKNGVWRDTYSAIGEEVDFIDFRGIFTGTSFSAPYLCGKAALLVERYGHDITHEEVYAYFKANAQDVEDVGKDFKSGWGLPIMPDINTKYITLTIGSNVMKVDGQNIYLDTEPIIDSNGRTLVPVRAIAEALGCEVGWIPSEQKVTITGV